MNRHILPLVLAAALSPAFAQAEESKDTLTLLPVARQLWTFGLEYEHGFGNTSWVLAGSVVNPLNGQPVDAGLDVGLRFYPFSAAPRWFFIGPHLGGTFFNAAREGSGVAPPPPGEVRTIGFNLGATAGVTLLFGEVFVISASAGGEYFREYFLSTETGGLPTARFDLRVIYRGAVGFAF